MIVFLKVLTQMATATCSLPVISNIINQCYFLWQSHWIMCSLHKCTLKDKFIHWDSNYTHCKFHQNIDALHEKLMTFSDTSVCVHHGQSQKEYIERHDWRALYDEERLGKNGV